MAEGLPCPVHTASDSEYVRLLRTRNDERSAPCSTNRSADVATSGMPSGRTHGAEVGPMSKRDAALDEDVASSALKVPFHLLPSSWQTASASEMPPPGV